MKTMLLLSNAAIQPQNLIKQQSLLRNFLRLSNEKLSHSLILLNDSHCLKSIIFLGFRQQRLQSDLFSGVPGLNRRKFSSSNFGRKVRPRSRNYCCAFVLGFVAFPRPKSNLIIDTFVLLVLERRSS